MAKETSIKMKREPTDYMGEHIFQGYTEQGFGL